MVHDVAVGKVFHRPAEMGASIRNIVAHWQTVEERKKTFLSVSSRFNRLTRFNSVPTAHAVPAGAAVTVDNELRRTDEIRLIHDILMAFRMDDDLPVRILLAEIIHVHRLKHLMHAAVALP